MENIAPKFMVAKCSRQNTFWLLKCIKKLHFNNHLLKHVTDRAKENFTCCKNDTIRFF